MKTVRPFFVLLLACCGMGLLPAQTASDICLVEVATAFRQIDAPLLLKGPEATRVAYLHSYVMRSDPKQEERSGEEVRVYDQQVMLHDSPDQLTVTDAEEAFNYRRHQFVVYRTRGSIDKASLLPLSDAGIFKHCQVRDCHFVPAPGHDSISYKRAYMTLDEEGQKRYQIKDLEFITNPHDTSLVSITANFTSKSPYVTASYYFRDIEPLAHDPGLRPQAYFLDGDGALKEEFKGASLKDYR